MASRISKLRDNFDRESALLITDPLNIRYLCGFTGSFGFLLLNPDESILFTDSRYDIQSRNETSDVSIVLGRNLVDFVREHCTAQTLVIEGNHMSVALYAKLETLDDITLTTGINAVENLRVVKDESEVVLLERAGQITTHALAQLITTPLVGQTERDIAIRLDRLMVDAGAEAVGFDTIVASGPNSAIPHHQPSDRVLSRGDLLKIDFGAQFGGYKSDCTRTFVIGKPDYFQLDLYSAVRAAQQAGRDIVKSGVVASEIDLAVRHALHTHEYGVTFQHGLGHGVGLAIHEDPFLSAANHTRLASGTVITIEPGMYVESRGGVRIEDTIVITDDGYRNLTDFTYDFISL